MCWFCNLTAFLSPPKKFLIYLLFTKKMNSWKFRKKMFDFWVMYGYHGYILKHILNSMRVVNSCQKLCFQLFDLLSQKCLDGKTLLHQYQKCCICYISLSWCMFQSWSMILSITHPNEALLKVIYGRFYTQISRFTLPHCCPNKTH